MLTFAGLLLCTHCKPYDSSDLDSILTDAKNLQKSSVADYKKAQKKFQERLDMDSKAKSDAEAAIKNSQNQGQDKEAPTSSAAAGSLAPMVSLLFFTLLARLV